MMENRSWLTVDEAAQILGLTPVTLRVKLATNEIKGKKAGREWRILKSEIDSILGITSNDNEAYIKELEEKVKYLELQINTFKNLVRTLTEVIN